MLTSTVRHRRPALALALPLSLVALLLGAPQSFAQPAGQNRTALEKRLAKQNTEADLAVDEYLQKKSELEKIRRDQSRLRTQLGRVDARRGVLQVQVDKIGTNIYKRGPGAQLVAVFESKDPAQTLQGMESLAVLNQRTGDLMAQYKGVNNAHAALTGELNRAEKTTVAELAKLARTKARVEGAVAKTKGLLRNLQAQDRANNVRRDSSDELGPTQSPGSVSVPKASGKAGAAVAFAQAQIGDPYQYGAAGPDRWDCSGLTMMAWKAAGVTLPRSSSAQKDFGTVIPKSQARAGDLVYRPGHIALYIGGGQWIAATHTGSTVKKQSVMSSTYVRVSG